MKISKKALLAMSGIFTVASLGLMFVFAENLSGGVIDLNVDPNNAIQHFKSVKIISTGVNDDSYAVINKNGNLIGIETDYNFVLTSDGRMKCDVDGDGDVDSDDSGMITDYILGNPGCSLSLCDINNDGSVDYYDFNICRDVILGLDSEGGDKLNNQISKSVSGSSILGGIGNKILGGIYNVILGGKENKVEKGSNSSILGGVANVEGNGKDSVIFGGRENEVTGSYSSIIGGEGNKVTKSYATAIGSDNIANGYNSVAMGSGSKVQSESSFLWSDGKSQERLSTKGVFAVKGENGMIVNATKAHSLAQLTVSGSLVVYDDKKTLECTEDTKGVLRVINGDIYNNNQKCFCSCDGSGRNALHEGTRCEAICNNGTGLQAECGSVRINCDTNPYSYTGAGESGACIQGELVRGTGAFLVDTYGDNTEWIHRSCQTSYGQVTGCVQQLTGESCPNLQTGYECIWTYDELTGHIITNPNPPVDSATFWKYDPELSGPCTYVCDQYGEWDPIQGKCIFHECVGELPEGAKLNDEVALPMNDTTHYSYDAIATGACLYSCQKEYGYYYSGAVGKCVKCPEGQTYDESDGTCKVACDMSSTSFGTITIMDDSGYAITIADRNLGATSNNTGEVSSYGCYFQWGNNYGFQPVGNLETSEEFVDTSDYGPGNPYSSEIFRVRAKMSGDDGAVPVFGPNDDDWSSPANDNLWGGANDSSGNAFGVLDSDKENRQGPCPDGYHVPSMGERNDLLIMWYNKEYKADGVENLQYIKDSGKIAAFRGTGSAGLGRTGSIALVEAFRDYFLLPPASSRTFIDFAPGVTYGHGGSFWTSSSPWLSGSFATGSLAKNRMIGRYPNVANSFDYNITWGEGYVGHGLTGRKKAAQSVRCFKDVPECPSGMVWNQSELKCTTNKDCDVEHTAIQDLELFFISSMGEISHYTMMDRNLGAFEVYNQKGNAAQNTGSLGCHFQWGNNYGFTLGSPTTRYGINTVGYGPNNYYSNNKFYCINRNGSNDDTELGDMDDDYDGSDENLIFGTMYSPIDYHMWGGGYIEGDGTFYNGHKVGYSYGSNGSDEDRRGPCPEGYHIPGGKEMVNLINNWNDASMSQGAVGNKFASDLLIPYGRYIEVYCGRQGFLRKGGGIWLSDQVYQNYGLAGGGHYMNHVGSFQETGPVRLSKNGFAHGFPVRCVRNGMVNTSQKVTIHVDGGTGAVIAIDWESEGSGKITALSSPTKNGINFLGWYSSLSFAPEFKVNTGDYVSSGSHIYARWDGCNIADTAVQNLEVFFLLTPTRISHYMMMDRNLGATEAFNQDISSPNESSYGCYFQWGNNYAFNRSRRGSSCTFETLTGTENYGPGRPNGYYLNSSHYCTSGSGDLIYPFVETSIPNATWFWGGGLIDGSSYIYGSDGSDIDRQGPCPAGYHIPRGVEMNDIVQDWKDVSDYPDETGEFALQKSKEFASDLLIPFAGFMGPSSSTDYHGGGRIGNYYLSDYYKRKNHLHLGESSAGKGLYFYLNGAAYGYSMRCVKNNISDTPQKVTIYADGGTGAVIAIDWESAEDGKIVTLGEPTKNGYDFGGWYANQSFTTSVNVGDNIFDGGSLYAKWTKEDLYFEDIDAYFISDTGNVSYISMMDRNMGAINDDISSVGSYGYHYQWGNNHGFKSCYENGCTTFPGGENTLTQHVNVSTYNSNPSTYLSNLFIIGNYNWATNDAHTNLWGGASDNASNNRGVNQTNPTDRRGPCPVGYHVPSAGEWGLLVKDWHDTNASSVTLEGDDGLYDFSNSNASHNFIIHFNIPFAGKRDFEDGKVSSMGDWADLWSSSAYDNNSFPSWGVNLSANRVGSAPFHRPDALSVRCFKDSNEAIVTIHPNGGTDAMILVEGNKVKSLGTPTREGYAFGGWYLGEGFITKVEVGDYVPAGSHLFAKWIGDQEFEDLELYFLKDDGNITHYTMMDRNMGATEIYNQDFNNPNTESFGYHYQWGNNWGFKPCIALGSQCNTFPGGESYTTNERVPKSEWSLKIKSRYESNVYREINSSPFNWMADANAVANDESTDMWGGKGDTKTSNGVGTVSDRQGPCPNGYYVPSTLDWGNIIGSWGKSTPDTKDGIKMASDLLLPVAGARDYQSKYVQNQGSFGRYWSSSLRTDENSRAFSLRFASGDILPQQPLNISRGASVRCIKGVTNPQTITIHANGGIKAVIAIDGGKITALGEPIKSGYRFEGWYTDEGFTTKLKTGDYISNGGHLYAKWDELSAIFIDGSSFNDELSTIAGNRNNIKSIKRSYSAPSSGQSLITVSTTDSTTPIYARYGNESIYYYTEAKKIYLNENSSNMFSNLANLVNIDMDDWNTENVTDMSFMFEGCSNLTKLNLSGWHTNNVTSMQKMFYNCQSLTGLDVSNWNTSKVTNMHGMFFGMEKLSELDVSNWDTSKVTDMSRMFVDCVKLENLDVSHWDTSSVINMYALFGGNNKAMHFKYLDVSKWNTSNVTNMRGLFRNCADLTGLDVSHWDTSKVTNMAGIFGGSSGIFMNLENLDVSNWNTSNVTNMRMMFGQAEKLKNLDVSHWDTSKVTDMGIMFQQCINLTGLDVSHWDTSSVTVMDHMFHNCKSLENLDVSHWDTSKVTDMNCMFLNCSNLIELDVSHWDTSNVTNMRFLFGGGDYVVMNLVKLDLSNWDTSKVTEMGDMFQNCEKLKTIYASTGFVTDQVISHENMFFDDKELVGGFGTKYTVSKVGKEYARIDSESQSGYFTYLKTASLLPGKTFNQTIKRLSSPGATYNTEDTNITNIIQTGSIPSGVTTGLISSNDSVYPIYARNDNGTIYYYTEADRIYMNSDSSNMFNNMKGLTELDLSNFNTSRVTDMSSMFANCSNLTDLNLSGWYTNKVTNMLEMFYGCESLTQLDVSNFNTSKVTNMSKMFENDYNLTSLDVSHWNTSNVTDMSRMFTDCTGLEYLDVSNWDTSNVTNMYALFGGSSGKPMNFKYLDVSNWDTSRVTNMRSLFRECVKLTGLDVSNWDTSKVTTMYALFCSEDNRMNLEKLDVSHWDTSNVIDMRYMFRNCVKLTGLDVSNWDTSNVTDMSRMFATNTGAYTMNLEYLDVSHWNTSSVIDMSVMFQQCANLTGLDVSNWDTSNVTDMDYMFKGCENLENIDVSNWDVSKVTNVENMFGNCNNLTKLDLSNWNTSNVTNMSSMFDYCKKLKTIYASTGFVTDKVRDSYSTRMFYNAINLVGGFGTKYTDSKVDKEYAKIDSESQSGYFTYLKAATLLPGKTFNQAIKKLSSSAATYNSENTTITRIVQTGSIPSGVTTSLISDNNSIYPIYARRNNGTIYYYTEADRIYMNPDSSYMFYNMKGLRELDINEWNTSKVTDMSRMFVDCISLENLDVSRWNTSKVTNMYALFGGNDKVMHFKYLDVSHWNTSNVTNMRGLFRNCTDLTGIDVSHWNTSKVTNMNGIFQNCKSLTNLDVSRWNTSNVTSMNHLFYNCTKLENLDVSNWNTSKVTNMNQMFANCTKLVNLDVSRWNTSNVTDMSFMFGGGSGYVMNLENLDVSNWDTSKVTDMSAMFQSCVKLTGLDLSEWNTSNVTDMSYMFGCGKSENMKLTKLNLSNWNTSSVTNMEAMFQNSKNLVTIYVSTGFVTNQVTNSKNMFLNDTKLVGGNGTTYNSSYTDKTYARIDKPGAPGYFTKKP